MNKFVFVTLENVWHNALINHYKKHPSFTALTFAFNLFTTS